MIDGLPTLPLPRRRYWLDAIIIAGLVVGISFILLWQTMFVMIPAGSVGALYHLFGGGTHTSFHYGEGLAIKWPWDTVYIYETRVQSKDYTSYVLSTEGLSISVDFTITYNPNAAMIGELHRNIGPDYYERKILPNAVEAVRQILGQYEPDKIDTKSTFELSENVLARTRININSPSIIIDDIVIRKIILPSELNAAITEKLKQEQLAQSYEFRLLAEQHEAERKRVEGVGIQTFYAIVSGALTPALLTWRGIEATIELSRSPNSKVVIVGGGKDQLPLILGSDIANIPPPGPPLALPKAEERPRLPDFRALPPLFPPPNTDPATGRLSSTP